MCKQPYIPFYTGDYIKDTRKLPLAVRGAWVDLLLFMWDEEIRGELTGSIKEFAGMLSCSEDECQFALNLLKQKKVCSYEDLPDGRVRIISRRMKRDIDISLKRSKSGKKGVIAKILLNQNKEFASANGKQNPDNDNEYDNEYKDSKGGMGEKKGLWNRNPGLDELGLELPDIKSGAVIELFHFIKNLDINPKQVLQLWGVFKKQNFTGTKYYESDNEVYSHFINWSKNQNLNGKHKQSFGEKPIPKIVSQGGFGQL